MSQYSMYTNRDGNGGGAVSVGCGFGGGAGCDVLAVAGGSERAPTKAPAGKVTVVTEPSLERPSSSSPDPSLGSAAGIWGQYKPVVVAAAVRKHPVINAEDVVVQEVAAQETQWSVTMDVVQSQPRYVLQTVEQGDVVHTGWHSVCVSVAHVFEANDDSSEASGSCWFAQPPPTQFLGPLLPQPTPRHGRPPPPRRPPPVQLIRHTLPQPTRQGVPGGPGWM
ncbi:uncharacterized protein PG998_014668 [Apiospora kogelbergensis]|uniref:uncharacterized protein n=1 Tax=Apiospora kogelbergensis TaxID=1337665 RepID=UPI00312CFDD2